MEWSVGYDIRRMSAAGMATVSAGTVLFVPDPLESEGGGGQRTVFIRSSRAGLCEARVGRAGGENCRHQETGTAASRMTRRRTDGDSKRTTARWVEENRDMVCRGAGRGRWGRTRMGANRANGRESLGSGFGTECRASCVSSRLQQLVAEGKLLAPFGAATYSVRHIQRTLWRRVESRWS